MSEHKVVVPESFLSAAKHLVDLRVKRDQVVQECEERIKVAKEAYAEAEEALGKDMARQKVPRFSLSTAFGEATFSVQTRFMPKVLDRAKAVLWLKKDKEGKHLLKEDFNFQSFRGFINERMKNGGKTPPPDAVDVASFTRTVAGLRIAGEKGGQD